MKYPRIPHDLKQHIKLTVRDIEQIRYLYFSRQVTNFKDLADSFNTTPQTIQYWIDPLYREIVLKRRAEALMRQQMRDPTLKDKQKTWLKNSQNYHHKIDPTYRDYCNITSKVINFGKYKSHKPLSTFRLFMQAIEQI